MTTGARSPAGTVNVRPVLAQRSNNLVICRRSADMISSARSASTGFRVVGQREMNDYLDTGTVRSPTGQIHVSKDPDSAYAIREDQTGIDPSYVLSVDLTQDRWDYKDYAQRQGAVHRSGELPMDRVKAIYGFRGSREMGEALES